MNVPDPKAGSELGEDCLETRARRAWTGGSPLALVFADAEVGCDQDVKRRMLSPICSELFEFEERHRVDYRVAVAASGGEEAINMSPAVRSL